MVTVWIPFVDATAENGCLPVVPRTQKEQVLSYHAEIYSGTGYTELDEKHLCLLAAGRVREVPVNAGSANLFNDRLVHCSTNNSDHVRWSVDLRCRPTDQDPMPQHGARCLARSRRHPSGWPPSSTGWKSAPTRRLAVAR